MEMGNTRTNTRNCFLEALSACLFKCLGVDYSWSYDETRSSQQHPAPPSSTTINENDEQSLDPPSSSTTTDPPPGDDGEPSSSTTDDPQIGGEEAVAILLGRQPTRPGVSTGGPPQTNQIGTD